MIDKSKSLEDIFNALGQEISLDACVVLHENKELGIAMPSQSVNLIWHRAVDMQCSIEVSNNGTDWVERDFLTLYEESMCRPFFTSGNRRWAFCRLNFILGGTYPHDRSKNIPEGVSESSKLKVWGLKKDVAYFEERLAYFCEWEFIRRFKIIESG